VHLRSKHPVLYDKMNDLKSAALASVENSVIAGGSSSSIYGLSNVYQSMFSAQPDIRDVFEKVKVWDINSDNAKCFHVAIAKMIAINMEPYHVVEKPRFIKLFKNIAKRYRMPSRRYFTERVVPD